MKTFQIKQNYGQGSYGFLYLNISENANMDDIEHQIIEMVIKDYENERDGGLHFGIPDPPLPTLYVKEYDMIRHCKKKGTDEFKVKWR